MQVETSQLGSVQAQFTMGINQKAQNISADLVDKLMTKSLDGTADQARAAQGVGTKLNAVA